MRNSGRSPADSVSADPLAAHHLRDLVTMILYFAESSVETAVTSRPLASASSRSPQKINQPKRGPLAGPFVFRRIEKSVPDLCSLNQIEIFELRDFTRRIKVSFFPLKLR